MSKQSEAKERQEYVDKFVPTVCGNCAHYKFDRVQTHEGTTWKPEGWFADKNLRCGIGGFAVKKQGSCAEHVFGEDADTTANAELSGPRPLAAEGSRSNDVLGAARPGKETM